MEKKRCSSIDALKGICAILVVLMHVQIKGEVGQIVMLFARCAVPIFLMISGYFLAKKCNKDKILTSIKKQGINILKLVLLGLLLYFILGLLFNRSDIIRYVKNIFNKENFIRLFIFNEPVIGGHLWYLFAYIYALIILYWIVKYKKEKYIYIFSIIGLIIYIIFGKYSLIFFGKEYNYLYVRNFLFDALPYVAIGFYLKSKELKKVKNNTLYMLMILFSLTLLSEYFILNYFNLNTIYNSYISDIFLAVTIFIYFINNNELLKDTFIHKLGREYSLHIYIVHPLINTILSTIFIKIGLANIYSYINWIIVIIGSIIASVCYNQIKNKFSKR